MTTPATGLLSVMIATATCVYAAAGDGPTQVSIAGGKWHLNGQFNLPGQQIQVEVTAPGQLLH